MTEPAEALSQLLQKRLAELGDHDGPMSTRAASLRARGLVSYETLRKLLIGTHSGRISDDVAQGISLAIDVPVSRVYEAAAVQQPSGRWKWPAKFDRLDPGQRRVVEQVAAALLDAAERDPRQR